MQQLHLARFQRTISRTGHDLKSPVTAMGMALEAAMDKLHHTETPRSKLMPSAQSISQLMQPSSPTSPRVSSAARPCAEAYAALMHLQMIVNRSQDYGLILAGLPLVPNPQATNVLKVVRSVVQWKAMSADVSVNVEPPPAGFVAVGVTDPSWLQDNLLCVVDNACKFTRRGSGHVRVFIRTVQQVGVTCVWLARLEVPLPLTSRHTRPYPAAGGAKAPRDHRQGLQSSRAHRNTGKRLPIHHASAGFPSYSS